MSLSGWTLEAHNGSLPYLSKGVQLRAVSDNVVKYTKNNKLDRGYLSTHPRFGRINLISLTSGWSARLEIVGASY